MIVSDHMQSPVSNNHSPRTPSGPFHTMGANGADFTPAGFGNHVRPKTEPDLVGSSPLDVFNKPYHHQQSHHHMHSPQQGYHGMAHFGGPQHHHNSPHAYSPQHATFPPNFSYGPVSNGNGTSVPAQDQTSTTPPPIRYMPSRNQQQSFVPYPATTQGQSPQSSQGSQQRHSLSPGQYGGGSPAMMMPSSSSNGHISAHDFNLQMGYHSPVTTSPSTFGGISGGSPQSSHPQSSHHHHASLPPTTQGWSDFSYQSYSAGPISDHHDQHDHDSSSP
ncbi:hypothetical protein BC939DRAFT_27792 [Gamsiella multidivaricata]|uniref:uncharacterized protein n=1 Tax=Gamsiella multidivaricata TaxID=101098 RepID=UPI002220BDF0|nr:uncharacterized protein BC939DRAFT_27792 [Gamsiella multidivaricata]KAI7829477.1 hypothetical protein BC939DRAFT_27792 [Gamsiella multidivaricata]